MKRLRLRPTIALITATTTRDDAKARVNPVLPAKLRNKSNLVTIQEMGLKVPRRHPRHRSFLKNLAKIESKAKIKGQMSVMNQVKSWVKKCSIRIRCQANAQQPLLKKS